MCSVVNGCVCKRSLFVKKPLCRLRRNQTLVWVLASSPPFHLAVLLSAAFSSISSTFLRCSCFIILFTSLQLFSLVFSTLSPAVILPITHPHMLFFFAFRVFNLSSLTPFIFSSFHTTIKVAMFPFLIHFNRFHVSLGFFVVDDLYTLVRKAVSLITFWSFWRFVAFNSFSIQ